MSPYEFGSVKVAIAGSEDSRKALDCALSICTALGAELTVLAVEGKLRAYAASLGEVDEVKREKDDVVLGSTLHIVSADTFGSAEALAFAFGAESCQVDSGSDKRAYVTCLGAAGCPR